MLQARDPIPQFREFVLKQSILSEAQIKDIDEEVEAIVSDAVKFADESPKPVSFRPPEAQCICILNNGARAMLFAWHPLSQVSWLPCCCMCAMFQMVHDCVQPQQGHCIGLPEWGISSQHVMLLSMQMHNQY